ncbi:flippase [bacterium]|nr:flippase [bacterium]
MIKNTFAIIVARGIQPLFSMILVFFIVRIWSPEDFGKYTTLFYLLVIFQVFCGFGLRNTLTRDVSKNRNLVNQYMSSGIVIAIPFSILSMLLMIGVVHTLQYESHVILTADILSISLIASALGECFEGILAGFEKIQSIAVIWIIETVLRSGLSIFLVYSGFGLLALVIVFVVFRFFNPIAYFFIIRKSIIKPKIEIDIGFNKELLKTTYIIGFIAIIATLFWRIDAVILQRMKGDVDVALYGTVNRLFLFSQMLIISFFTAFFPIMARLFSEQKDTFQRVCNKSIQYLCIINLAVALFVMVYSEPIVLLFFGSDFLDAAPALVIFMWAIFFFAINELLGYVLLASNHQKLDLRIQLIVLLSKVTLNFIFLNKYSYVGAAIATLISLLIMLVLKYGYVAKHVIQFQLQRLIKKVVRLSIAGTIMLSVIYLLKPWNLFIVFIFSVFIYSISLFALKIFSDDDISFFKEWFNIYIKQNRSGTH